MERRTTHGLEESDKGSRYLGEREGSRIVNWLNALGESDEKQRFIALLDRLKRLQANLRRRTARFVGPDGVAKLNGSLNRYTYRLSFVSDPDEQFRLAVIPTGTSPGRLGAAVTSEALMVNLLMFELWRLGRVDRIRQCQQCGRWLFARLAHHRFCPATDCARKSHQSKPSFKARRRAYMRRYYADKLSARARSRVSRVRKSK
jgi:hypothetical protein